jgi:hypothetical protein
MAGGRWRSWWKRRSNKVNLPLWLPIKRHAMNVNERWRYSYLSTTWRQVAWFNAPAAIPAKKEPPVFNSRFREPHSAPGLVEHKKTILAVTEREFLSRPAHSQVTILTELSRLLELIIMIISPFLQTLIICLVLHALVYSSLFQIPAPPPPPPHPTPTTATAGNFAAQ